MALINPLKDITLMSPLEWDAWDNKFKTKVNNNNLWVYIDLIINGKKFLEKPIKPKALDFLKYIHQSH